MCKNLVEKSNLVQPLLIYNRTAKRAIELSQTLPADRTEVIESLGDAITNADIIFTCVANDQAVDEIFAVAVQHDLKGKVFVECSTIAPGASEAAAKSVLDKGADFVCAPIFGAPAMVAAGNATLVLAGPKASIEKIRPYVRAMASREINMTDEPYHKAATLKLLGNSIILGFVVCLYWMGSWKLLTVSRMVEQLAETYVAAEKSGLETDYVKQFVDALFGGSPYPAYSVRMLEGDYYKRQEPLFAVDLARKDAGHAIAIAKAAGTRLYNIETADKHLQIVKDHAGPSGDIAGVYGAVRKEAGLRFENDS
ncbi:NAD(P)-binding protein [Colletotrichum somersetense]|nr:NAD(P)-binding protein [Colletotrichum somersetense]